MSRPLSIALILLAPSGLLGCDRPGEEDCQKAVENIRRLSNTERSEFGTDPSAAVRSCRANASKESVQCMIAARTQADLIACEGQKGGSGQTSAKPSASGTKPVP